jgi:serine/threonine protein kinase
MSFTVPGYEVGQLLGFGSHGQVWRGQLAGVGTPVALKRIAAPDSATALAARAEAALLATLSHPHLIELREFVVLDDAVVLVLELADGGSLAELLSRRNRVTPAEVAASLSPIGAALAHAHNEGVLHGDLSASNVLFTSAGYPKLADLGVARMFGASFDAIGTPAYVDPVVAAGGAAGAASDVFSLAAVALHALTGRGPWQTDADESAEQVLSAAATGVIDDLAGRLADCPAEMASVLVRALDAEPHRRGTAAEFALDLRAATQTAQVVLSAGRTRPTVGRHSVERDRRAPESSRGAGSAVPPERPTFSRPRPTESDRLPADLTHISRPQVRSSVVEPIASRGIRPFLHQRRVQFAIGISGVAILGVAFVFSGLVHFGSHRADAASGVPDRSSTTVPAPQLLAQIDSLRSQAFAQRRPELLGSVYASTALLTQDVAQLNARVPTDCRLVGLVTSYRHVTTIAQSPTRIELTAEASLASAELRCHGAVHSRTAAAGPTTMRIVLAATGTDGSFAIASVRLGS